MPEKRACFQTRLLGCIPRLRAYAVSLCGNRDDAADLVQESLVKAWGQRATFKDDTPIEPWMYTILRNTFYSQQRKSWREVPDIDGCHSSHIEIAPEQNSRSDLADLGRILMQLCAEQREAFILIYVSELSYEEAAVYCNCPIGTIRSRVNRARKKLVSLLEQASAIEEDEMLFDQYASHHHGHDLSYSPHSAL